MESTYHLAWFVSFELCVLLTAVGVVSLAGPDRIPRPHAWLITLLFSALLQAVLVLLALFTPLPEAWTLTGAALLTAVAILLTRGGATWRLLQRMVQPSNDPRYAFVHCCAAVLLLTLAATQVRRIEEVDSLGYYDMLMQFVYAPAGLLGYVGYPMTWESTYLPAIVIAQSKALFWWGTLKAKIAAVIAVLVVAREIKLDRWTATILGLAGVGYYAFWSGNAGVATWKNDAFIAAGALTVAAAGVRVTAQRMDRCTAMLFVAGSAVCFTKYTGVFYLIAACGALTLLAPRTLWRGRWGVLTCLGAALLTIAPTSGYVFVRNYLIGNNPFGPVRLAIGDREIFPGQWDLRGTSILERISQPGLWRTINDNLEVIGPVLPLLILVSIAAAVAFAVIVVFMWVRRRAVPRPELAWLAALLALGWLLYIRAPWSASATTDPNEYIYLSQLGSLRYAIATVWLSALLALRLTELQFGVITPRVIALLLALPWLLRQLEHAFADSSTLAILILLSAATVALLLTLFWRHAPTAGRLGVAGALVIALFAAAPALYQRHVDPYGYWDLVYERFAYAPPTKIAVVASENGWSAEASQAYQYPLAGFWFQHDVTRVDEQINDIPPDVEYIVWLQNRSTPGAERRTRFFNHTLRHGFALEEQSDFVAVGAPARDWTPEIERFFKENPNLNPAALIADARQAFAEKRADRALQLLQPMVVRAPTLSGEASYLYGLALAWHGQYDEALPYYDAALEAGHSEFWVRNNRAHAFEQLNRYAEARLDLIFCIDQWPHDDSLKERLSALEQAAAKASASDGFGNQVTDESTHVANH